VELLDALDETGAGEVVIDDDAYWRLVVRRQWAQEAAREECAALAPTPDHNCQADDLFDTHPMAGIQHAPLYRGSRVTGEVACRL
jgi:hypothetical protein